MFPPVDTKDPTAVASFVGGNFTRMHPKASLVWLNQLFRDIEDLFTGRRPDYGPVDLRYHDLEHTLQATVCLSLLLAGRHRTDAQPELDQRNTELALSAALLHDTGYLKLRSDTEGTGAKYTYCHVPRSCAFAAAYLSGLNATEAEIETVLNAINCTGPTKEIGQLKFRDSTACVIGCALGTADYLGQMAAPDYPDELEALFNEFSEADDFIQLPVEKRMFKSAAELIERTPRFWQQYVRRKLELDFQSMYQFLAEPYPDGRNPYVAAVEANIAEISRRIASAATVER
jgi:hypothetical protein